MDQGLQDRRTDHLQLRLLRTKGACHLFSPTQMQCMHCRQSHCAPPISGGVADIRSGLDLTAGGRISNILALFEPVFRPRGIIHVHSAVERVDRCFSTAT